MFVTFRYTYFCVMLNVKRVDTLIKSDCIYECIQVICAICTLDTFTIVVNFNHFFIVKVTSIQIAHVNEI